jgi:SAM-dependent methyltransferase
VLDVEDDVQERANARLWSRTDLVGFYANRTLRAVESTLLLRYRDELSGCVLELGCGGGRLTGYLLEIAREVDAIDVSPTMLAACQAAYPSARCALGDVGDLSGFAADSFDAVVAGFSVLDVLSDADRRRTLADLRRIIVPGGLLVMSSHNRDAGPDRPADRFRKSPGAAVKMALRVPRWLPNRRRLTALQREEPGYAVLNDSSHDFGALHYYITRDDQERQLHDAGFTLLECLDLDGLTVAPGARSTSSELHYLAS